MEFVAVDGNRRHAICQSVREKVTPVHTGTSGCSESADENRQRHFLRFASGRCLNVSHSLRLVMSSEGSRGKWRRSSRRRVAGRAAQRQLKSWKDNKNPHHCVV